MLSNETIEIFNKKYNDLIEQTNRSNEELDYLNTLLSKYNLNEIDTVIDIPIINLIIATLICTSNLTIEQCHKLNEEYIKMDLENLDEFDDIAELLIGFFPYVLETITDVLEEIGKQELLSIIINNKKVDIPELNKKIKSIKALKEDFNTDTIFLIEICDSENKSIIDSINLAKAVIDIKNLKDLYSNFKSVNKKMAKKLGIEIPNEYLKSSYDEKKEFFNIDEANKILNNIRIYYETLRSNSRRTIKNLNKELDLYNKINDWVENNKDNTKMLRLPSYIEKITDNELKFKLLNDIYISNCKYYSLLMEKHNNLSQNSYNNYNVLLQKYGIDMKFHDIDLTKDIQIAKNILEQIKSMNITDPKSMVYILNNSTYDNVITITNLYNNKYIDTEYINNNLNIFTEKFDNIVENIKLYLDKKMKPKEIRKIKNSLIFDKDLVSKNIDILEKYKLLKINDNSKKCEFLNCKFLEEKIDFILELGLEKYLKDDLSLLNRSIDDYKKIILLKRINMPIENKEMLLNILDNNLFSNIDDYIYNVPINNNIELDDISKYDFYNKLSNLNSSIYTFDIDGLKISKNKVFKNINNIDNDTLTGIQQLNIVCSNSVLDENELEKIVKFLKTKKKQYKT